MEIVRHDWTRAKIAKAALPFLPKRPLSSIPLFIWARLFCFSGETREYETSRLKLEAQNIGAFPRKPLIVGCTRMECCLHPLGLFFRLFEGLGESLSLSLSVTPPHVAPVCAVGWHRVLLFCSVLSLCVYYYACMHVWREHQKHDGNSNCDHMFTACVRGKAIGVGFVVCDWCFWGTSW